MQNGDTLEFSSIPLPIVLAKESCHTNTHYIIMYLAIHLLLCCCPHYYMYVSVTCDAFNLNQVFIDASLCSTLLSFCLSFLFLNGTLLSSFILARILITPKVVIHVSLAGSD